MPRMSIAIPLLVVLLGTFAVPGFMLAPWVPTKRKDYGRIAALLELGPDDRLVELGCGTGGLLAHLARATPAELLGIELSPIPWAVARFRAWRAGSARLRIRLGDAFALPLADVSAVYVFGVPDRMPDLKRKFAELPDHARVVSYVFPIEGWVPDAEDAPPRRMPIHRYRMADQRKPRT